MTRKTFYVKKVKSGIPTSAVTTLRTLKDVSGTPSAANNILRYDSDTDAFIFAPATDAAVSTLNGLTGSINLIGGEGIVVRDSGANIIVETDVSDIPFDSAKATALVTALVDSNFIQNLQAHYLDSGKVTNLIDSDYIRSRQITYDFLDSGEVLNLIDSAYINGLGITGTDSANVVSLITDTVDSAYVRSRQITYDFLDSGEVINLIDSDYVRARQITYDFLDSSEAINLFDSAYVQARQITYDFLDSSEAINLIDSAYVQARQDFSGAYDSAKVQGQFDSNIASTSIFDLGFVSGSIDAISDGQILKWSDSANSFIIAADLLGSAGSGTDASTFDGQTPSYYLNYNNLNNTPLVLDSATVLGLIDSAHVQARQITYDFLDSSEVINLVDSAYVQARVDFSVVDFLDSGEVINLIDSAYVQARQITYDFLDSGEAINLIDSAYVQARVDFSVVDFLDSGEVINLIDSAYVQARQLTYDFLDSGEVINLIDSAYVNARVVIPEGYDSAKVQGQFDSNIANDIIFGANVTATGKFIGDLEGAVEFIANNASGTTLSKGEVVYISGISGETPEVNRADANDPTKLPAFGVVAADANNNAETTVFTFGSLTGLNTSGFSLGDILYVSDTAGQLTNVKPAGEASKIQNIGYVTRVHASNGSIKVSGAGRTAATPNLDANKIFIGNDSGYAETRLISDVVDSAYVQARQITYDFLDSGEVINLIDSAYVQGKIDQAFIDTFDTHDSAKVVSQIDDKLAGNVEIGGTLGVSDIVTFEGDSANVAAAGTGIVATANMVTTNAIEATVVTLNSSTGSRQISRVLLTHDGTDTYLNEYAVITTDSNHFNMTADTFTGDFRLKLVNVSGNIIHAKSSITYL